jgi:hypothetical protein
MVWFCFSGIWEGASMNPLARPKCTQNVYIQVHASYKHEQAPKKEDQQAMICPKAMDCDIVLGREWRRFYVSSVLPWRPQIENEGHDVIFSLRKSWQTAKLCSRPELGSIKSLHFSTLPSHHSSTSSTKKLPSFHQWCAVSSLKSCSQDSCCLWFRKSHTSSTWFRCLELNKIVELKVGKTRRAYRIHACVRDDDFALRRTKIETSTKGTCVKVHVLRLSKVLSRQENDWRLLYTLNQIIPFILTFGRDHLTIL